MISKITVQGQFGAKLGIFSNVFLLCVDERENKNTFAEFILFV